MSGEERRGFDYDRGRLLVKTAASGPLAPTAQMRLLALAGEMETDSSVVQPLFALGSHSELDAGARAVYTNLANRIRSSADRERVLGALRRRDNP